MSITKVLFVVAGLIVVSPAIVSAAPASPAAKTATLAGTCVTSGAIVLPRDVGQASPSTSFAYTGTGNCFGVVAGQTIPDRGAPATMTMQGTSVGCAVGAFADGPIRLTIKVPKGPPVQVDAHLDRVVTAGRTVTGQATFAHGGGTQLNGTFQGDLRAPRACVEGHLRGASVSFEIGPVNVDPTSALPQ